MAGPVPALWHLLVSSSVGGVCMVQLVSCCSAIPLFWSGTALDSQHAWQIWGSTTGGAIIKRLWHFEEMLFASEGKISNLIDSVRVLSYTDMSPVYKHTECVCVCVSNLHAPHVQS